MEVCDAFILNATASLELDQKTIESDDSSSSCPSNSMSCDPPPSSCSSTSSNTSSIVEVWEDDEMIEFEFFPSQRAIRLTTIQTNEKDQDQIDTLDGEHLPYFFGLTREERKIIRESVQTQSPSARFDSDENFHDMWSYKP